MGQCASSRVVPNPSKRSPEAASRAGNAEPVRRIEIQNLIHALAISQDTLDLELFGAVWKQNGPSLVDLSRHIPEYPPKEVTASAMAETMYLALAGFDGTQHVLSNMTIIFDPDNESKAMVRNYITAYHYMDTGDGRGEHTTMRGMWETTVERQGVGMGVPELLQRENGSMGDWAVTGIQVSRNVPLSGRGHDLYAAAKERAKQGKGRVAKSVRF